MDRENHLRVDKFAWDQEYNDVHQWLDETYIQHANKNPYRHWLARHHIKAIAEKY